MPALHAVTILIIFCLLSPAGNATAAPAHADGELLDWRYDPAPLVENGGTFGNVAYDPARKLFRLFYHRAADSAAGTIHQKVSASTSAFDNDSLVLGHGVAGAPDEQQTGVPYAWYESGESRPWRMLYRGCRSTDGLCSVMLATSTDGVDWERKDTKGNELPVALPITDVSDNGSGALRVTVPHHPWSTGDRIMIGGVTGTGAADLNNDSRVMAHRYWQVGRITADTLDLSGSTYVKGHVYTGGVASQTVIQCGSSGWDQGSIDFGSVIKVGATYHAYYSSIATKQRCIGLATSADLVRWTKYAVSPLYAGVTDYDDKNHNGAAEPTAGFFCPDIVFWPRRDGSDRYVMVIPHYATNHTTPSFDVYVSNTPVFTKANRTYIGKAFDTAGGAHYLEGRQINGSGADTPRIITDDITRNVATSRTTGNRILMVSAVYAGGIGWNQVMLVHHILYAE